MIVRCLWPAVVAGKWPDEIGNCRHMTQGPGTPKHLKVNEYAAA
jgi:hypothetical protein